MNKKAEKITLTKEQINFFNKHRKKGESLRNCVFRIMGDSHRIFFQSQRNSCFLRKNIDEGLQGDSHPYTPRIKRITIEVEVA